LMEIGTHHVQSSLNTKSTGIVQANTLHPVFILFC
jgi:hypothetical protein